MTAWKSLKKMHPDLLNNSLFLRYYNQWQKNPDSIVFTAIADYFLQYGMLDDAFRVCNEGIKHHPDLTLGHLIMAKIYVKRTEYVLAKEELRLILEIMPNNKAARELLSAIDKTEDKKEAMDQAAVIVPSEWQTITMAKIYASQGHIEKAKEIFANILSKDPNNSAARTGLESIGS